MKFFTYFFMKPGTDVKIAWAMHSSMDGNVDISKHTGTGVLPNRYTLVPETGSTSTSTSTTTGAASILESRVMFSAILAAIAVFLVS